jgi:hypothetical protein
MATQNIKVHSGNRAEIKFDGKFLGLLQGVQASDDYGPEPASGVGDIHAQEYVPTMARHSVSADSMVLIEDNMRKAGIAPENGDSMLEGLIFDIEIYGKGPSAGLLRKYIGCSYASGSISVQKHAIVVHNAQFNALDVTGRGL